MTDSAAPLSKAIYQALAAIHHPTTPVNFSVSSCASSSSISVTGAKRLPTSARLKVIAFALHIHGSSLPQTSDADILVLRLHGGNLLTSAVLDALRGSMIAMGFVCQFGLSARPCYPLPEPEFVCVSSSPSGPKPHQRLSETPLNQCGQAFRLLFRDSFLEGTVTCAFISLLFFFQFK